MNQAPPEIGPYWASRLMPMGTSLERIRAGPSHEFDNAARLKDPERVHQWWARLSSRIDPRFYPLLHESVRGTPARHPLDAGGCRYMASVSSIEFAAMATALVPAIEAHGSRSVNEIGGGYGGLASAVLRSAPEVDRWTIIDIPETAQVSRWYLAGYPQARVLDVADVASAGPADVVVQTRGFMEMSTEEVAFYFGLIQGGGLLNHGGLFWTINRRQKKTRFVDYPFDRKWEVLRATLWPEGDMIEALLMRVEDDRGDVPDRLGLREDACWF